MSIESGTNKNGLFKIDPADTQSVEIISRMHLELLHWGPMARLGNLFLQKFCYVKLIEDGLMRAALYFVNGQPAGFIAYTHYSITFHRLAIKKHFFYVSYIMLISFIKEPSLILNVIKAIRLIISRRDETSLGTDPSAEILAIGVYPEFRTPKFIKNSGIRISHDLFGDAASFFREVGLKSMRLVVDSFNKPTLFYYHSLGGRSEPYERGGDPMIQFWFDLEKI
jgi:hypothetical protein